MERIYLDYAASTPIDPHALRAMEPYFTEKFGNPGSLHSYGQEALAAIDMARETIASAIDAKFRNIIFTGSATEANNLALRGAVRAAHAHIPNPRVIISAIEHESVLETARDLGKEGVEVIILPVKKNGVVDIAKLPALLNERTVLVSIVYANNETGVIQPIEGIANIIREFKSQISNLKNILYANPYTLYPLLHTDAAQAFQFLDCNPRTLGVDLMTLSAHKIYGPKGIGALYVRQVTGDRRQGENDPTSHAPCPMLPIVTGGGQEFGLRSGTENVPLTLGFAKAVELVSGSRESWNKKIESLRDYFLRGLKKISPRAEVHGINVPHLPHIANSYFPNHTAEDMLTYLDLHGVAISAGSACRARSLEASPVLIAMGYSKNHAKRSIRVSFGRPTTMKEIDKMFVIIKNMR